MNPNPPNFKFTDEDRDRPDWTRPLPEHLSRPAYWPAMLAFSITLILLGPVTMLGVSLVGLCLAAVALVGWVKEIFR